MDGIASMFGSWGVSCAYTGAGGSCEAGPFFIKDGKVVVSNMQEEYKEAVKYFTKLYTEGLINVDTFTGEANAIKARGTTDPYSVGSFTGWSVTKAERLKSHSGLCGDPAVERANRRAKCVQTSLWRFCKQLYFRNQQTSQSGYSLDGWDSGSRCFL